MSGARRGTLLAVLLGAALAFGPVRARAEDAPTDPAPEPAPGAAPEPAPAEEPEAAAAPLDAQIKRAIERGVAYLRSQQRGGGTWGDVGSHAKSYKGESQVYQYPIGPTAIALYALLKCDVPVTDPAVRRGFEWLKKAQFERLSGYELSVALLAVTAVADPFKKSKDSAAAGAKVRLTAEWRTLAATIHQALLGNRAARGWRYFRNSDPPGGKEDVSSTMLAVLALAAADRCGLPTDPAVFGDASAYVLTLQEADGPEVARVVRSRPAAAPGRPPPSSGGRYAPPADDPAAPVMDRARGFHYSIHPTTLEDDRRISGARTACGVGTLAICRYQLEAARAEKKSKKKVPSFDDAALKQAIFDGLAWLSEHWDPWGNPGDGNRNVYYLYCVERAMDLVGAERLGEHLWYVDMVQALLPRQDEKGFWDTKDTQVGDRNPVVDTSLALLFLRRAAKGGVPVPIITGDDEAPPVDGR